MQVTEELPSEEGAGVVGGVSQGVSARREGDGSGLLVIGEGSLQTGKGRGENERCRMEAELQVWV